MILTAKLLTGLAVILALASVRYPAALKGAVGCVVGVALCLVGSAFL